MSRIRTIDPHFPQTASLSRVSREARLFFILLWTFADDAGRLRLDHERLKEPPHSFAELVEGTIKGKWRVALPNAGYTGTPQVLIWSLAEALGGSVTNVDPAFNAIKKMKPNVAFFASITDPLTLLESG